MRACSSGRHDGCAGINLFFFFVIPDTSFRRPLSLDRDHQRLRNAEGIDSDGPILSLVKQLVPGTNYKTKSLKTEMTF